MKELLKHLALPALILTSFMLNEATAANSASSKGARAHKDQDARAQAEYEYSYERDEGHAYEYINEHPEYDGDTESTCAKAQEPMLLKACKVYHGT